MPEPGNFCRALRLVGKICRAGRQEASGQVESARESTPSRGLGFDLERVKSGVRDAGRQAAALAATGAGARPCMIMRLTSIRGSISS